jgi:hypothetical protein
MYSARREADAVMSSQAKLVELRILKEIAGDQRSENRDQ